MNEEVEKQRKLKYKLHDLPFEDLKEADFDKIRGYAIRTITMTKTSDRVAATVDAFMSFLTSKGYRISKEDVSK